MIETVHLLELLAKRFGGAKNVVPFTMRPIKATYARRDLRDMRVESEVREAFAHTFRDLKSIATGKGQVRLYHGAPTDFAEKLVARVNSGDKKAYWRSADEMGRYIANTYNIPYTEFYHQTGAGHFIAGYLDDKIAKLSTATAPVASRWAMHFPYGEVLSDLNNQARLLTASKQLGVNHTLFYEMAHDLQRQLGLSSNLTVADALGIPDLLLPMRKGGSLVEVVVDARAIPDYIRQDAASYLKWAKKPGASPRETLLTWNHGYKDIKIAPQNIRSARIVRPITPDYPY